MNAAANDRVRVTRNGRVATLMLDRAEQFNAIDIAMATALDEASARIECDPAIDVLVISGAGRVFCAGGDIGLFAAHLDDIAGPVNAILDPLHRFLLRLQSMPQLVLTSVHGTAAGAGMSIAFMGDLCIAADDAVFRPSYASLGVSPDAGGTVGVVRAIGERRALQLFLADEQITCAQALALGLVARAVRGPDLSDATCALANGIAAKGRAVISATKALIRGSGKTDVSEQLEAERAALLDCMASDRFRANVTAFVASRGSTRAKE